MSTPQKIDARTAAKRRAARRKQTRLRLQQIGVLVIVLILVLGVVSSFVGSQIASSTQPGTAVTAQPTSAYDRLLTAGDQAYASGVYTAAVGYYGAYLSGNPAAATNADLHYKLGVSYIKSQPPDYANGLAELQQALSINPNASWASDAGALMQQYATMVPTTPITGTATLGGGGTGVITGTSTVTSSGTLPGTGVLTATAGMPIATGTVGLTATAPASTSITAPSRTP